LEEVPWLTVAVATLTGAGLVVQELVPGTLGALERTPKTSAGEPWRWLTSLVVQDGWLAGGVFNIAALVLAGIAVERLVARRVWLVAYVGGGLVGQVFGRYWQPVGGGNSVAVCGLVGLLVVLVAFDGLDGVDGQLPRLVPPVWCGALAAAVWWPLVVVGGVLGSLVGGPVRERPWSRALGAAFCGVCAIVLIAARDLHGGTLVVAMVASVAAVMVADVRHPLTSRPERRRRRSGVRSCRVFSRRESSRR
jgi:membrane associated rhomboid family serine protease